MFFGTLAFCDSMTIFVKKNYIFVENRSYQMIKAFGNYLHNLKNKNQLTLIPLIVQLELDLVNPYK